MCVCVANVSAQFAARVKCVELGPTPYAFNPFSPRQLKPQTLKRGLGEGAGSDFPNVTQTPPPPNLNSKHVSDNPRPLLIRNHPVYEQKDSEQMIKITPAKTPNSNKPIKMLREFRTTHQTRNDNTLYRTETTV